MRKALIGVIALMSFGACSAALAKDDPECRAGHLACGRTCINMTGKNASRKCWDDCAIKEAVCEFTDAAVFKPPVSKGNDGGGSGSGSGGGSKPKQVNGQSQRTADGGTIMLTPEGKEWVWNGKYTTVVTINRVGYQETISVMQGDPTVSLTKVVDGRRYNVADPAYAIAIAASQAKVDAAKAQQKAAAQQASTQQKQNYINNAQSPTGILGAGRPKHVGQ